MIGIAASVALTLGVIRPVRRDRLHRRAARAEIGIRMALGAQAAAVGRDIMLQAMVLAGLGIAVGFLGVVATAGVLQSLLFEVQRHESIRSSRCAAADSDAGRRLADLP